MISAQGLGLSHNKHHTTDEIALLRDRVTSRMILFVRENPSFDILRIKYRPLPIIINVFVVLYRC